MGKIVQFPNRNVKREDASTKPPEPIKFRAVGRIAGEWRDIIVELPPYPNTNGSSYKSEQLTLFTAELIEIHRDKTG